MSTTLNLSANKAILKIKETRHPVSEETIGFRLQAAIPNQEGGRFDKEKVSFRKAFLILESGDYPNISHKDVERFVAQLQAMKFEEFIML